MLIYAVFRHSNDYDHHSDLHALCVNEDRARAATATLPLPHHVLPARDAPAPPYPHVLWRALDPKDEGWTIEVWEVLGC